LILNALLKLIIYNTYNIRKVAEIIKSRKDSGFITRRFFLSPQYKESDYRILGDEPIKRGQNAQFS